MVFPITIETFRALRFRVVAFGDEVGAHWNRMVCAINGLTKYNCFEIRPDGEWGKKKTHYYYDGKIYFENDLRELIKRINERNGIN